MSAHPLTQWFRRGSLALICAVVCLWTATGNANQDHQPSRDKTIKVLNKSPWVIGIWGTAGADTPNPGMDAMAREQQRKAREDLERREKTDTSLAGSTLYQRSQDLRRLEKTEGGSPAELKRTPAPVAVRWISAASMLDAIREAKQPSDPNKAESLSRLLNLAKRFYVIAIGEGEFVATKSPVVFRPIEDAELAGEVRRQTFLVLPDGRKIGPAAVELFSLGVYHPTPVFLFPRTVNGEPTIGPSVSTVTFHYDKLDVKFNVSKMKSDGKPDL